MARYYGVECKLCCRVIALGECGSDGKKSTTLYAARLDPPCPECGSSYLYGTDDLFGFEAEENILQFPAKTKAVKPNIAKLSVG
jgi:hypothetical protein